MIAVTPQTFTSTLAPQDAEKIRVAGSDYTFSAWMNATDRAISLREDWNHKERRTLDKYASTLWAHKWLELNEMLEQSAIDRYLNLRPLLENPGTVSSTTCRRCGARLTNRFSVAIGIGPECRRRHSDKVGGAK